MRKLLVSVVTLSLATPCACSEDRARMPLVPDLGMDARPRPDVVAIPTVQAKQLAKLVASDKKARDRFGHSVAVSGTTVVVGAPGKPSTEVKGSGAAYVFEPLSGQSAWKQTVKLLPSDKRAQDRFGFSVAVSGNAVVVGAPWANCSYGSCSSSAGGAAYMFEKVGGQWTQVAKLIGGQGATLGLLGSSVSVSGNTAVVGSPMDNAKGTNVGAAYVFEKTGGSWQQAAKLVPSDVQHLFGYSVSVSGTTISVGTWDTSQKPAAVYVFEKTGGRWKQVAKFTARKDTQGPVAVSGSVVVAGALTSRYDSYGWKGYSSMNALIFEKEGSTWKQMSTLWGDSTKYLFGHSVSASGTTVVVGADWNSLYTKPSGGSLGNVHVLAKVSGSWFQVAKFGERDHTFGRAVSVSGSTVVVGADGALHVGASINDNRAGSAYIYRLSGLKL